MTRIRPLSGRARLIRILTPAAAATALLFGSSPAAPAAQTPASDRVALTADSGLVPAGAVDEGAAAGSASLPVRVYLTGRDQSGLRALAQEVSTPGDAQYRRFLTPAEYEAEFGSTPQQVADVTSWLHGCGLTVAAGGENYLSATGSRAAVACAVGARIDDYTWRGTRFDAPAGAVSVPRTIGADVLAVTGLGASAPAVQPASTLPSVTSATASAATTSGCSTSYGASQATALPEAYGAVQPWQPCGYTPSQLRSAYGVSATSLTGTGTRVAVVDAYASSTLASDTTTYAAQNGDQAWATGQLSQLIPAGIAAQPTSWTEEETLDVEAVHAIAPSADVLYVAAAGTADTDFLNAITKIVDGRLADLVSGSWVLGADTGIPTATVAAYELEFLQGAVEGIGFDFAAGDTGSQAASDDGAGAMETATNYPAVDPWVTAVGGTTLAVGSSGQSLWQTGWETDYASLSADGTTWVGLPGGYADGSGGGPSGLFPRPWYQAAAIPAGAFTEGGTPRRTVPDVAMDADPVTGMLVGQTFDFGGTEVYVEYASGGTSMAAPLWAGIQALAQQRAGHPLGFANPLIYRAAAAGAFHAATGTPNGGNPLAAVYSEVSASSTGTLTTTYVLATFGQARSTGLSINPGYDDVTGVGTPTAAYFDPAS